MTTDKNILYFNYTKIEYSFPQDEVLERVLLNYLTPIEIKSLIPLIFHTEQNKVIPFEYVFIHMVFTPQRLRRHKLATQALEYFKQNIFPHKEIILFCENNYQDFNLIDWYKKLGFKEIYSNLECTLMIQTS